MLKIFSHYISLHIISSLFLCHITLCVTLILIYYPHCELSYSNDTLTENFDTDLIPCVTLDYIISVTTDTWYTHCGLWCLHNALIMTYDSPIITSLWPLMLITYLHCGLTPDNLRHNNFPGTYDTYNTLIVTSATHIITSLRPVFQI